jgi:hypothetical protein
VVSNMLGGFFDEIIFRCVFIVVPIDHYQVNAWIVIILSVLFFIYDHIIQLDTVQKYICVEVYNWSVISDNFINWCIYVG